MSKSVFYAIYDSDENLIFVGTSIECCSFLDTTIDSFYCAVNRSKNGRRKGNTYMVYRIDDLGEDEDE